LGVLPLALAVRFVDFTAVDTVVYPWRFFWVVSLHPDTKIQKSLQIKTAFRRK